MSEYVSCEWLESGMDFDVGFYGSNIQMCCYVSCPGGGNIMLKKDYDGSLIDWDDFWEKKNKYRNILKSGGKIPECEGCVFLEKRDWPEGNYINSVIFDHFTNCHCDCVYCYTHNHKDKYNTLKSYNVLPVIKDMVERGIFIPGGQIGFGGGEPTMLKEFEDLITYLIDNGFDNINIPTSGIIYSPVIAKGLAENKLMIQVSLDSGCRETYKLIKGVDAFDKVVENLKKYAAVQYTPEYNVISKYIICPGYNDSKEEIDLWFDTCKSVGIEYLFISVDNIWLREYMHHGNEKVVELVQYALDKGLKMFYTCKGENHVMQLLAAVDEDKKLLNETDDDNRNNENNDNNVVDTNTDCIEVTDENIENGSDNNGVECNKDSIDNINNNNIKEDI